MIDKFLSKIDKSSSGCWEWHGTRDKDGYGHFCGCPDGHRHGWDRAHRWSHRYFKGEIPKGLFICHKCDNPSCVNPDHLFLGTNNDNVQDCINKGRSRNQRQTHCVNGHQFNDTNTIVRRTQSGRLGRQCRKCAVERTRQWRLVNGT